MGDVVASSGDALFMDLALREASKAGRMEEVPVGAVIVDGKQQVISRAGNRVETFRDASAHAEMLALRQAASRQENWRLVNCTLYSTLEPCPMCLSACQAFRVGRIVYGAPDLRLGAVTTHMRLLDITHPFHNVSDVVGGIRQDDSAELLREFFRKRRKQGKMASVQRRRPKPTATRRILYFLFPWRRTEQSQ